MSFNEEQWPEGSPEWRLEHIRVGDAILNMVHAQANLSTVLNQKESALTALNIRALAELAQAHYQAANVRYRNK